MTATERKAWWDKVEMVLKFMWKSPWSCCVSSSSQAEVTRVRLFDPYEEIFLSFAACLCLQARSHGTLCHRGLNFDYTVVEIIKIKSFWINLRYLYLRVYMPAPPSCTIYVHTHHWRSGRCRSIDLHQQSLRQSDFLGCGVSVVQRHDLQECLHLRRVST